MDFTNYRFMLQHCSDLDTEQGRQRFITLAGRISSPPYVLTSYEQMLLDQYVRGNLSFDQVQDFEKNQKLFR